MANSKKQILTDADKARMRVYYLANKERIDAWNKEYRKTHSRKAEGERYRAKYPEKIKASKDTYKNANAEKVRGDKNTVALG